MSRMNSRFFLFAAAGAAALLVNGAAQAEPPKPGVAGSVDGQEISLADVDAKALGGNMTLAQQLYDARKQALDEIIMERALADEAKSAGITVDALIEKKLAEKASPVTDADVQAFYDSNKARMGGKTMEQVGGQIRDYLKSQRDAEAKKSLLEQVKAGKKVQISIDPPRANVKLAANDPVTGGQSAKVTVVEFSDFQCPFCSRAHDTIDQVRKDYGDKIKLVFRHYPLPFHNRAQPAALAADCANEQGKFWEYHDKLFANQQKLEDENLKQYATDLGLDAAKFSECLESAKYKADIEKDMKEGQEVGVTGTPAFFVNGRFLSGAQPIETFKTMIDEELERSQ